MSARTLRSATTRGEPASRNDSSTSTHTPPGEPTESLSPDPSVGEPLAVTHARLLEAVRAKRMRQEVEAMRAELDGEPLSNAVTIEGTSVPRHKRAASQYAEPSTSKYLKLGKL